MEARPEEKALTVNKGDLVLLDFTGRIEETGEIFETTSEDEAKKGGVYREDERYGPRLIVVGEGELLKSLEEKIVGMREGEEKEFKLPPSEAYGERDPSNIRTVSLRVFRRAGVTPKPGMTVEVRGRKGVVLAVSGGRARVDFNHPLAGKTLVYRVKVVKVLRDPVEKLKGLFQKVFRDVDVEKVKLNVSGEEAVVEVSGREMLVEGVQLKKALLAENAKKYLGVKVVKFTEVF